jgi:hypothetical protein
MSILLLSLLFSFYYYAEGAGVISNIPLISEWKTRAKNDYPFIETSFTIVIRHGNDIIYHTGTRYDRFSVHAT